MPHRFAALALAGAVGLTLAASVPALAADKPIVGSVECDALVDTDATVDAALAALGVATAALGGLPENPTESEQTSADAAVTSATTALAKARAAAELELCVDLPVDTTDPEPTPTTDPDPVETTDPTPTTAPEPTTTTAPTVIETQINGDVTVNPTADDGSVANTSGTQVTVVPEGSAQTGGL